MARVFFAREDFATRRRAADRTDRSRTGFRSRAGYRACMRKQDTHHGGATSTCGSQTAPAMAQSGSERIESPTQEGATIRTRSRATGANECAQGRRGGRETVSDRRPAGDLRAGSACRNRGTSPIRFRRYRETRAGASSTAASPDSGNTREDPPAARQRRRFPVGWTLRHTFVSHACRSGFFPLTVSKNIFCSRAVIGPRRPPPMGRWSYSRIGVTSAAVPVKNASSAT